jgi:hypothetical protein
MTPMLTLQPLPPDAPELGVSAFPDHLEPNVAYPEPTALDVVQAGPGGLPDFMLVLHRGVDLAGGADADASGGWLRVGLMPQQTTAMARTAAEAVGWRLRPFPLERVQYRVATAVTTGPGEVLTDWLGGSASSSGAGTLVATLTPHAATAMAACIDAPSDAALVVRARGEYRGFLPGVPALVSPDPVALPPLLAAALGDGPFTVADLEAAVAGLPLMQVVESSSASPGLSAAGSSSAPLAVAWQISDEASRARLLPEALLASAAAVRSWWCRPAEQSESRYRLATAAELAATSPPAVFDLAIPRIEVRTLELEWSLSATLARLDPAALAAVVVRTETPQPFAAVPVVVAADVPAGVQGLSSAVAEVQTPGPTGVFQSRTLSLLGQLWQRFTAVYPALTDSWRIRYRSTCVLSDPDHGAVVLISEFTTTTEPVVRLTPADLGLLLVCLTADDDAFDRCDRIVLTLTATAEPTAAARSLTVTRDTPRAWLALPAGGMGSWRAILGAQAAPDRSAVLRDGFDLDSDPIHVGASELRPAHPDEITARLDPRTAARTVFILFTLTAPGMPVRSIVLDRQGPPKPIPVLRNGVLDPLAYRWQVAFVAIDAAGATLPLATTPWRDGEGPDLLIDLADALPAPVPGPPPVPSPTAPQGAPEEVTDAEGPGLFPVP